MIDKLLITEECVVLMSDADLNKNDDVACPCPLFFHMSHVKYKKMPWRLSLFFLAPLLHVTKVHISCLT